jgi:branched-chain amino acid transport system ATP-binding protein
MALLDVSGLDASYGAAQVLFDVSFGIEAGTVVVLLGRNGAGKSTCLKAIMGLEVERRGDIRLSGRAINRMETHRIARQGLGFVPEDRRIFAGLTVDENLTVGVLPPREGLTWARDDIYSLFPELSRMTTRLGGRLSGGEQQMLTIARTLMGNPQLVLLDEPSEGLAPIVLDRIATAIRSMKARGVGLLVSEQNLAFTRRFADRVLIMERGQIRFSGSMAELDAAPAIVERYLSV